MLGELLCLWQSRNPGFSNSSGVHTNRLEVRILNLFVYVFVIKLTLTLKSFMHIYVQQGLDIPLAGKADESVIKTSIIPTSVAINLNTLASKQGLRPLIQEGDVVKQGMPIAEDKGDPRRKIASPATGTIQSIVRGPKRVLEQIVITCTTQEKHSWPPLHPDQLDGDALIEQMLLRGLFSHIRQRPFDLPADPTKRPRSIFVKALESAPFTPQPDSQMQEHSHAFQMGLFFLKKLTSGKVHLVHRRDSCEAILNAQGVDHHSVSGPHPRSNPSLHIHNIDPIQDITDVIWTLSAWDVLVIGLTLSTGEYFCERFVSLAGEGILPTRREVVRTLAGAKLADLLQNRIASQDSRLLSGDPLMGREKSWNDHLDREHTCISAIALNEKRQPLHFLRLGLHKFTASRTYLSGFIKNTNISFTTSLHGEERGFIDGAIYERVMPMRIPTMHLVKAAICDDYQEAELLGLLEVAAEDFALATFVCPSKIEMVHIMHQALGRWAQERL